MGTLSKVLFAGLRIAYAVVPQHLVRPLTNIKSQIDLCPSTLTQAIVARFIESGELETHIRRMTPLYAAKRNLMVEGITRMQQGLTPSLVQAGFHMTAQFGSSNPGRVEIKRIRTAAQSHGLAIGFMSDFSQKPLRADAIFLRYGGLSSAEILLGLAQLKRVLNESKI